MPEPIEITFWGKVSTKKNNYRPRKGGKGFFKDTTLQGELDALLLQIPPEFRNLKLVHPDIEFRIYLDGTDKRHLAGRQSSDKDGHWTTIQDILVSAGVLRDDSIRYCNGNFSSPSAQVTMDGCDRCVVVLTPK